MMDCISARQYRHVYLDGEIDPAEASELEAHLGYRFCCRAVVAGDRELSRAIKLGVRRHRAPDLLALRIRSEIARLDRAQPRARPRFRFGWNPAAIAASFMLAVAASSGLTSLYMRGAGNDELVQEVVSSHVRSLMADHLTDVPSSDRHVVRPWFDGKLDIAPPVADLAAAGYALIGGRLDYVDGHSVAALVYEREQHVINVLVLPRKAGQTGPAEFTRKGFTVICFPRPAMGFWVVSDLNAGALRDFVAKLKDATNDWDLGS